MATPTTLLRSDLLPYYHISVWRGVDTSNYTNNTLILSGYVPQNVESIEDVPIEYLQAAKDIVGGEKHIAIWKRNIGNTYFYGTYCDAGAEFLTFDHNEIDNEYISRGEKWTFSSNQLDKEAFKTEFKNLVLKINENNLSETIMFYVSQTGINIDNIKDIAVYIEELPKTFEARKIAVQRHNRYSTEEFVEEDFILLKNDIEKQIVYVKSFEQTFGVDINEAENVFDLYHKPDITNENFPLNNCY